MLIRQVIVDAPLRAIAVGVSGEPAALEELKSPAVDKTNAGAILMATGN